MYTHYMIGVTVPVIVLAVCFALLDRPLLCVLQDLLGTQSRARFFRTALFTLIATSTIAGSLLPEIWIDTTSQRAAFFPLNTARQFLAAGFALLLGLAFAGGLLGILIYQYERHRPERGSRSLGS